MPLTTSLVGYWTLDNTGTDATGNGNTLSLSGSGVYTGGAGGKINNGLSCPGGASDGAHTGSQASGSLDFAGAVSMQAWVKPTGSGSYQAMIDRDASGNRIYSMFLTAGNTSSLFVAIGNGTFSNTIALSSPWVVNSWNHIVVTADGSNITAYLNGASVGSAASAAVSVTGTADTSLGYDNVFGSNSTTGTLDECAVWARALSSTEVSQLYNGGSGLQYPFSGGATFNPAWARGRNRVFEGLAS